MMLGCCDVGTQWPGEGLCIKVVEPVCALARSY